MTPAFRRVIVVVAVAALSAAAPNGVLHAQPPATAADGTRVPATTWTVVKPEQVGYSSARFEALRRWLETTDTKAMLVARHWQGIFQ